jgi:formylglycine-generating enzyme required for sulfatase activity
MIDIPEGEFTMGTSMAHVNLLMAKEEWALEWFDQELFTVEQPQHKVELAPFSIAMQPITNVEYYQFAYTTGYKVPKTWIGFMYPDDTADHPVTGVSKIDAEAYSKWITEQTGKNYRLPTEAEWERTARGLDTRIYPWGDDFDPWRCNTSESGKKSTTPVGAYAPIGNSPVGAMDMVGNVWEWTTSILASYPYDPADGREQQGTFERYVIRGGSWYYTRKLARCSAREGVLSTFTSPALGFRLASSDKTE